MTVVEEHEFPMLDDAVSAAADGGTSSDAQLLAVIGCFDALDALISPSASTTDAASIATKQINPIEKFENALAKLRKLVPATGGDAE